MSLETTWFALSFSLVQMQPYLYQNKGWEGRGKGVELIVMLVDIHVE